MTFAQDGVKLKPQGMEGRDTSIVYADLDRVKTLGRGATSKVYLVRHRPTGDTYALKELNAMAHADTRRMAINELRIAHKHAQQAEHLVHFVDAFFSGEKICICMEFADGFKVTDEAKLDAHCVDRAKLVSSVAQAFAYCVHVDGHFSGDPHPGNILVLPRVRRAPDGTETAAGGQAVLLDWGLAKTFPARSRLAISRLVWGTGTNDVGEVLAGLEAVGTRGMKMRKKAARAKKARAAMARDGRASPGRRLRQGEGTAGRATARRRMGRGPSHQ